jgi:DNA-directed RNA polymerase specialized sigma subunit
LDIIEASRRNAPERGALRSYPRVYVDGEVYHYLRDKGFLIKMPASWRELHVRGQYLLRLGMPAVELPKLLEVSAERRREIGEACGQQVVAMEVGEVDG